MTDFLFLAGALAALVGLLLAFSLLRGRRDTRAGEAFDLHVYRDQLKEVERDRARGVIAEEEAERLRTEVSRRLLAADARVSADSAGSDQPKTFGRAVAALIVAAVVGGGFGLYAWLGAPGYGDLSLKTRIARAEEARASRPAQADAEAQVPDQTNAEASAEYRDLVQRLRGAVAERPDDLQGFQLLARSEAALGNYSAAWKAQRRIVEIRGAEANAKDYADLGDMMVLAAGGYVSPEAESAFRQALERDPQNGPARYYLGLSYAQTGRPDRAFRIWDELLRGSAAGDPWVAPVRGQIEAMAQRAGVTDYRLPEMAAPGPGPSREQMRAAEEMDPGARDEMIRGMVSGLSERLMSDGGSVDEWVRLISSLGVLGERERAAEALEAAEAAYEGEAQALERLRGAARDAGALE
ncbi:cytochrome C [Roseivivax halodurans JCM 10272]|uniref:Cytochrome C n=1 Tax=Roseivivax halodurans JCM 10272 TaxID=1449350 RepID=X7EEJ0_9RHOB|nr:c-type cytochrome biogenesis protein CcmI [Roseivivax halodurans]ETX14337.1 cytochrome C [Roseivivax halodurans JCM 10272]